MSTTLVVVLVKVEVSYGPQSPELSGQYLLFSFRLYFLDQRSYEMARQSRKQYSSWPRPCCFITFSFFFVHCFILLLFLFYYRSVFHMEENNLRA